MHLGFISCYRSPFVFVHFSWYFSCGGELSGGVKRARGITHCMCSFICKSKRKFKSLCLTFIEAACKISVPTAKRIQSLTMTRKSVIAVKGYIYIYIYIHSLTHIYIYTHTHTHIYIYIHSLTHTHTHIHTHIYIYTQTYIYTLTHIHTHIHTHIYIYIYIYIHIHTHIYIYMCVIFDHSQNHNKH